MLNNAKRQKSRCSSCKGFSFFISSFAGTSCTCEKACQGRTELEKMDAQEMKDTIARNLCISFSKNDVSHYMKLRLCYSYTTCHTHIKITLNLVVMSKSQN